MKHGGQLKQRIDFLAPAGGIDKTGQPATGFEPVHKNVPARVRFLTGAHGSRGEQTQETATHEVVCRWIGGVNPTMRIRTDETELEIVSCGDPEGYRRWLVCKAVEVT